MDAAVEDVHHRHRQNPRLRAADIAEQRQAADIRRGFGDRQRNAENGIGAESRLVGRAVERDHRLVDRHLILGVEPGQSIENVAIDGFDRLQHALAAERVLSPSRSSTASCVPVDAPEGTAARPKDAIFQGHVDFDRGIAAAIQNFAASNIDDRGHKSSFRRVSSFGRFLRRT